MPSKRSLRHSRIYVKAAIFAPVLLAIGYLAGSCFLGAWQLGQQGRILASALTLAAGLVLLLLCAMLAGEFERIYHRWMAEQHAEDSRRCARPECDRPLGKRACAYVCMVCIHEESEAETMPLRARKAGA
jgi:Ca2+/H+ antiporter